MKTVKCLICGLEMKDRINGSHLKRSHDIDLNQYKEMFPDADLGKYRTNPFECKACGEVISGVSETVWKHIYYKHGFNDIDEYNIEYEKKKCLCGCGETTNYSYNRHIFNDYVEGHYVVWNKGLTKEDHPSLQVVADKRKGYKMTDEHKNKLIETIRINAKDPEHNKFKYEKTKEAMLKKYGVENPFRLHSVKQKIKQTNLERYGVESAMQNSEISDKSFKNAKKYKEYVTSNGEIWYLQGYEIHAIKYLIDKYGEENIVAGRKNVPRISYRFNNKNKKYFPDFYVSSHNLLIEIKSDYIYEKELDKNKEKFKAAIGDCFKLLLLVYNGKKQLIKEELYEY